MDDSLGTAIRAFRSRTGLTQLALARELRISARQVARLEAGGLTIKPALLTRVAGTMDRFGAKDLAAGLWDEVRAAGRNYVSLALRLSGMERRLTVLEQQQSSGAQGP
jgi:transcriptional regulator with XRE-family HTH domain